MRTGDIPAAHQLSFEAFADLDSRLGDPVPEHTEALRARSTGRIAYLFGTDPDGAWVADRDGALAGVALALRRGPLWYLSLLTVAPQLQGQGLGRRLLEAALGTLDGAAGGLVMSSGDPKALRRYARAGFTLLPGYDARGVVDRAAVPGGTAVRESDLERDGELVDDLVTGLRSAPYGPDLQVMAAAGVQVLIAEDGGDRGFALWAPERLVSVGATSPRLGQRLLWAVLARTTGEIDVGCVTGDQQWAVPVLVAARLALRPGSSSCRRGVLGPMTPYLPNGAYG